MKELIKIKSVGDSLAELYMGKCVEVYTADEAFSDESNYCSEV